MPIHNWSRLEAALFRDFYSSWYVSFSERLNEGLLPKEYYALIEQAAGDIMTDILTLHSPSMNGFIGELPEAGESIAVATMPPKVGRKLTLPRDYQNPADKQLVIRHVTDDRVVAIIEIVSHGNKSSEDEIQRFMVKSAETIRLGIHLLVIDLHPPTARDPQGIHGAISGQMGDHSYEAPPGKPLTLVSYVAMPIGTAYVEAVAVGDSMPPMPLFLDEGHYVNVPLEETYAAAYRSFPRRWKPDLER
ncbi:MAG: DUF4058 family protein [Planctomycetes bacterium]|nr:DUF4058 family protein [Planctomycetota bacterium]